MSDKDKLKKVLIVDDEEDILWSLQNNLCNDALKVDILVASSGEQALEVLNEAKQVDLVITDIKMPGISGLDLLIEIKNRYPYTSVIIMTAFPSNEFKREAILKGSLHFLEKPFDINELREMVTLALKEDNMFKGTVAGVGLTDVIQIKALSGVNSALRVKEGEHQGIIYFEKGRVIHAICDDLEGDEAFYQIMEFNGGLLDSVNVTNMPDHTIEIPVEALLMEGVRRMDEKNAARAIAEAVSGNEDKTVEGREDNAKKEDDMADLKDVLTEFTNIPGVNTACLVGRDGFLLDSIAIAGIDTEMIGAIASSGFGASESMGNQLGKGALHMSMIEYNDGPVMLSPVGADAFLVVVAEKDANLGMIRLKIKKHTSAIVESAAI
ncbi:MAG: response regulator [Desulfurivibrionaceae bacterium]|nr:response regulator [Desulfurivibrionaceae bacterium]